MLKVSTGLRNQLLDTAPLRTILNNGFVKVYAGVAPATADDAITVAHTLLYTLSVNGDGTGLTFEAAAVDGGIAKNTGEIWAGLVGVSDYATFYRHVTATDTGAASTTEPRIQGVVGEANTDMILTTTLANAGETKTLNSYVISLPAVAP